MFRLTFTLLLAITVATALAQGGEAGSAAKIRAAKSISGTMTITFPGAKPQDWKFRLLKPNLYLLKGPDQEYTFDGKVETTYFPTSKEFQQLPRPSSEVNEAPFMLGFEPFFEGGVNLTAGKSVTGALGGKPALVVTVSKLGFSKPFTLYLDPESLTPAGYDQPMDTDQISVRYRDVKLNEAIKPEDFAWTPPADAKRMSVDNLAAKLLKQGAASPAPPATGPGGAVDLGEQFKGHKATLLYFWAGPPPLADLPALKELATRLKDERLQIVAVLLKADATEVSSYVRGETIKFPVILDDKGGTLAKAYGVVAQTVYVVDGNGKVACALFGFDSAAIARELRKLGLKL